MTALEAAIASLIAFLVLAVWGQRVVIVNMRDRIGWDKIEADRLRMIIRDMAIEDTNGTQGER